MRAAFVSALHRLMDEDERVVLLTADLGYHVLEPLFSDHPKRVINVGVAEQNMAGMAAGLARCGRIPFTYSIATFATLRGYEFVRNGAVVHGLPVRVIGIGGGFEYGSAGISHYALEDIGLMRMQPGMMVLAPSDALQAAAALRATWDVPGPVYYRIGKNDRASLEELEGRFRVGHAEIIRQGGEVALLATGAIAREAADACRQLEAMGILCSFAIVACLAPAPREEIASLLASVRTVVTVESHYLEGGLGSLTAEIIAEEGIRCKLVRAGVDSVPDKYSGSQRYMEHRYGLDAASLARRVQDAR